MGNSHFKQRVKTKEELCRIVGAPNKLAPQKIIPYLDRHCREFIKHSPFSSSLQLIIKEFVTVLRGVIMLVLYK
jgi:hypothetical protein